MEENVVYSSVQYDKIDKAIKSQISTNSDKDVKKSRIKEKIVFLAAVVTIVFLTHAVVYTQWLLPYYYVIVTPILITIRVIMYWKAKWQFFLLDFCYYVNTLWLIFLWIPESKEFFAVVFALSNGPLMWATVVYRNSLVFHHIDKFISIYIHMLPPLLSFGIRWHTKEMSKYWFRDFVPVMPDNSPIWLFLIPFAAFLFHSALYFLIVNVIARPSDDYITSFNYLGKKQDSCLFKVFNIFGDRCRTAMFYVFNWIFCILSLTGVFIWFNFYIAHCVFLGFIFAMIVWNGGNYYIEVFSVRGLKADEDC